MCRRIPQLISRIAHGELPSSEARRVDLHLSLCDSCRAAAADKGYRPLTVSREEDSSANEDFAEMRSRLAGRIDNQPGPLRPSFSLGWIVAGAVACAGIAAVFIRMA